VDWDFGALKGPMPHILNVKYNELINMTKKKEANNEEQGDNNKRHYPKKCVTKNFVDRV